jgi:hypothetical protein
VELPGNVSFAASQQAIFGLMAEIPSKKSSKFKSLLNTPNKSREILTKARLSP